MSYYTKDQVQGLKPINDLEDSLFSEFTTKIKQIASKRYPLNQKMKDVSNVIKSFTERIIEDTPRNYYYPDTLGAHSGVTIEVYVKEKRIAFENTIKELLLFMALKVALSTGKSTKLVRAEALTTVNNLRVLLDLLETNIAKEDEHD